MEQINQLIVYLLVISNFSKDVHYTAHGDAFYSKHLLVDKFETAEYIDMLKEACLLGKGVRPLPAKNYLKEASYLLAVPEENNDKQNFETLQNYIENTLDFINNMGNLTKADENVIGDIAQDLQQYRGLINLQVE